MTVMMMMKHENSLEPRIVKTKRSAYKNKPWVKITSFSFSSFSRLFRQQMKQPKTTQTEIVEDFLIGVDKGDQKKKGFFSSYFEVCCFFLWRRKKSTTSKQKHKRKKEIYIPENLTAFSSYALTIRSDSEKLSARTLLLSPE